jgi:ankyrin repeat protein
MPTNSEFSRLNLEYYRKQAKALLKAAKSGAADALSRLAQHAGAAGGSRSSAAGSTALALHEAQLVVAREQGFASWPRFKAFLEQSHLDFQGLVSAFIDEALSDLSRASKMLAKHPEMETAGLHVSLVLGDVEQVQRAVDESPALLSTRGGPRKWQPLLYVCFSRFAGGESSRSDTIVETAKLLLQRGADPNASYPFDQSPHSLLSCLYGATGYNNNPALGLVVLKAGANPNDHESLYHSTEHADLACLRLLLEHGASPAATNALNHMLDREEPEGLRLLLDAGADPNEINQQGGTSLHWAVWRGRSVRVVAALLDKGVALDARRNDGRTAYALAVLSGQTEVAALLQERGANTELPEIDRFIGACSNAGPQDLKRLLTDIPEALQAPENERLLPDLAMNHRTSSVRALLAAGLPVNARGELGATALHWACWKGYADTAKLLIEHNASLTIEDQQYQGTPPGWFGHGVQNCNESGGDYPEVARLLIAAGAAIPTVDLPTGKADVDAVLREHGLIG